MISRCNMRFVVVFMLAVFGLSSGVASADAKKVITDATKGFKDVTLTAKVVKVNMDELKKISKDLCKSYEFKTASIKFKMPDMMRTEAKIGMVKFAITINGDRKSTSVPALHIADKDDLVKEPHKRDSDFDIGIMSGTFWHDHIIKKVEEEKTPNGMVYKITYVVKKNEQENRICWVDAKTLKLLKMEKYREDGVLRARFIYSNHTYVQGIIWVPTRVEVYNRENKLAGVTSYENIKVNTGLSDSTFKL